MFDPKTPDRIIIYYFLTVHILCFFSYVKNIFCREFPGSPVIRTWHFYCCCPDSIPGWGTKIQQTPWRGQNKKVFCGANLFKPESVRDYELDLVVRSLKSPLI